MQRRSPVCGQRLQRRLVNTIERALNTEQPYSSFMVLSFKTNFYFAFVELHLSFRLCICLSELGVKKSRATNK